MIRPAQLVSRSINRELGEPVKPSLLLEVMALDLIKSPMGRYQDEIVLFLATIHTSAASRIRELGLSTSVRCPVRLRSSSWSAGSPGASQPRAPTERNVTVSRHSALLIHPSEVGHPCPVDEESWLSSLELTPPPLGSLE